MFNFFSRLECILTFLGETRMQCLLVFDLKAIFQNFENLFFPVNAQQTQIIVLVSADVFKVYFSLHGNGFTFDIKASLSNISPIRFQIDILQSTTISTNVQWQFFSNLYMNEMIIFTRGIFS